MYRLHPTAGVLIDATGEHIQPLKSDARWLAYRRWLKAGGVPLPAIPDDPPTPYHDKDADGEWVPNLARAREAVASAWNLWRDAALVAGVDHGGHVFHSDDRFIGEAQLLLSGYERGLITGPSAIRTRDNTVVMLDEGQIQALLLAVGHYRQTVYAQSWAGKDALPAMTALEDILAAWPPG